MESTVVRIAIGALIVALLMPIAIDLLSATDTAAWDANVVSIWNVFPVFIILGIALLLWRNSRGGSGG